MDTRQEDIQQLREEYKSANPHDKRVIAETAFRINKESRKIHSMREALIKAHRNKDVAEIKDIHKFIQNKQEYKNE